MDIQQSHTMKYRESSAKATRPPQVHCRGSTITSATLIHLQPPRPAIQSILRVAHHTPRLLHLATPRRPSWCRPPGLSGRWSGLTPFSDKKSSLVEPGTPLSAFLSPIRNVGLHRYGWCRLPWYRLQHTAALRELNSATLALISTVRCKSCAPTVCA